LFTWNAQHTPTTDGSSVQCTPFHVDGVKVRRAKIQIKYHTY
jgi:hypothetical protein